MPIYGYKCNFCEAEFDMLRTIPERELPAKCPNCEETDSRLLPSAPATTFRFADQKAFK